MLTIVESCEVLRCLRVYFSSVAKLFNYYQSNRTYNDLLGKYTFPKDFFL